MSYLDNIPQNENAIQKIRDHSYILKRNLYKAENVKRKIQSIRKIPKHEVN